MPDQTGDNVSGMKWMNRLVTIALMIVACLALSSTLLLGAGACWSEAISSRFCAGEISSLWAYLAVVPIGIVLIGRWILKWHRWRLLLVAALVGWLWIVSRTDRVASDFTRPTDFDLIEPSTILTHGLLPALALLGVVYAGQALYARHKPKSA